MDVVTRQLSSAVPLPVEQWSEAVSAGSARRVCNILESHGTIARWTEGIVEIHTDSGVLTPYEALVDLWTKYEIQ